MGKKVEEEVVQLRFDNANFEKNVKQSISTLDKLKNALKFKGAEQGVNNVQKAVNGLDFSKVEAMAVQAGFHIQDVWQKVSSIIEYQIAGRLVNAGKNIVKGLSIDQVSAGYSKYDQKVQNVQTLVNSTGKSMEEIEKYLAELMWYSDETSFGFTDMTSALATMTSSGGDIEKLIPMIEGMGNAVAYAGKGAAEFQRVIYNLNQSYSSGALNTQDWKSVQLAGASSKQLQEYLVKAAEEVGTIKKGTGDIKNFAEYMSKKKITSKAMEIAFTRFAEYTKAIKDAVDRGEYETATEAMEKMSKDGFDTVAINSFNAAQNAKSFTEAIEATKDAVSSGWMTIFDTVFGNITQATETWTALCDDLWEIFASGFDGISDNLAKVMNSKWDQFSDVIDSAGVSVEDFMKSYKDALGLSNDDTIFKNPEKIKEQFENGTLSVDNMFAAIKRLGTGETEIIKVNDDAQKLIEKINRVATLQNKEYSKMATKEEKEELVSLREELLKQGNFLDQYNIAKEKSYKNEKLNLFDLSESQLEHLGYTKEEINQMNTLKDIYEASADDASNFYDVLTHASEKSGRELLIGSFGNALHGIMQVMDIIKEAWGEIFEGKSNREWINILQKVYDWTQKLVSLYKEWGEENNVLSERGEKLKSAFKGLFAVFDIIWQLVKAVIGGILDLASAFGFVGDGILDTTANLGDWLTKLDQGIKKNNIFGNAIKKIVDVLKKFIEGIKNAIKWLKDLWDRIAETPVVKESIDFLEKTFTNAMDNVKAAFEDSGGTISKFFEKITGLSGKVDIDQVGDKVVSFFDKLNFTTFKEKINTFKLSLKDGKNAFIDFFAAKDNEELSKDMSGAFGSFGETISKSIEKIKSKLKGLDFEKFKGLIGIGLGVGTFATVHKTAKAIEKAFKSFSNIGPEFVKTLQSVRNALSTWVLSIKVNAFLKIAIAIGVLVAALVGLSFLPDDKLEKLQKSTYIMLELFAGLGALITLLGVFKISPTSALAIVEIGAAMLILVGALSFLEKVQRRSNFGESLLILIALVTGLSFLSGILSKLPGGTNLIGTILPLCLGLLLVVQVLKKITELDPNKVWAGIRQLITLMGGLVGSVALMSLSAKKGIAEGKNILLFVLSIFALELALKYIIKHGVKASDLKGHWDQIAIALAGMLGLSKIMAKAQKGGGNKNLGKNMLAMALSIILLGYAIQLIGELPIEVIEKGGIAVAALEGVTAACMRLMSGGKKSAGKFEFKNMIVMVIGVLALSLTLLALKDIPFKDLMKSVLAVSAIMFAFGYCVKLINDSTKSFTKMSSTFDKNGDKKLKSKTIRKQINNIASVILSFVAIAGIIFAFVKFLDPAQLEEVPGVVFSLSICLLAIVKSAEMLNKSAKGTATVAKKEMRKTLLSTLLVFAAVAAILFGMIAGGNLLGLDYSKVINVAAAVSLCVVAVGAAVYLMSKTGKVNSKQVGSFLLATISLIPIAAALFALTKWGQNLDKVIPVAAALSLCLVAVGAALMVMNIFPANNPEKAGAALLIGALSLIPIALAIGLMIDMTKGVDIGRMLGIVATLSIALIALTGCLVAITAVTAIPGANGFEAAGVLGVIGLIADVLAGVTLLMADFLGSTLDPEAVSAGLDMIVELVTSIGEAIAGFTLAVIPALGQALSDFATNIQGFINVVSNIDEGFGERVAWLVLGIMGILAAEVYNAIINFLTLGTGMTQLAVTLAEFGVGVKPFIEILKDIKKDDVEKAGLLADIVLKVTAAEVLEGISSVLKWLTGTNNNSFEETFTSLGKGVAGFADSIKGKSFKNVDVAVDAINALAALQDAIGKEGGVVQWFTGTTDMSKFGEGMGAFGKGLADFSKAISDPENPIDAIAISDAAAAAQPLIELSKTLVATDGWWQIAFGTQDIADFGEKMDSYAKSFGSFMKKVNDFKDDIDVDAVQNMADAATPMVELAKNLTATGGWLQDFIGQKGDIEEFGRSMANFASYFETYLSYARKVNDKDSYHSGLIAGMMKALLDTMDLSEVEDGIPTVTLIGDYGSELVDFGKEFVSFCDVIKGAETGNIPDNFTSSIRGIGEALTVLETISPTSIATFGSFLKTLNDLDFNSDTFTGAVDTINVDFVSKITELFDNLITIIQSAGPNLKTEMDTALSKMAEAFDDAYDKPPADIERRIESLMKNIKDKIRDSYDNMHRAGEYLVEGLIAGMESKKSELQAKATELGEISSNATANALGEESPSKVYKKIGAYAGEGLVIGLDSYKKKVYDSGADLGNTAIDAASAKMGNFVSILSDMDDFNPVIRPTLDLSNVTAGAKQVGALFNNTKISASADGSQNGGKTDASKNVTYNQYNYSPKALSRIDIYRQTRNQLSMSKG